MQVVYVPSHLYYMVFELFKVGIVGKKPFCVAYSVSGIVLFSV